MQPNVQLPKQKKVQTYVALLTQTGTAAPVPTILYNNANLDITWTRYGGGIYHGTINNYDPDKIHLWQCASVYITNTNNDIVLSAIPDSIYETDGNIVEITTWGDGTGHEDGAMNKATFRIDIYTDKIQLYV